MPPDPNSLIVWCTGATPWPDVEAGDSNLICIALTNPNVQSNLKGDAHTASPSHWHWYVLLTSTGAAPRPDVEALGARRPGANTLERLRRQMTRRLGAAGPVQLKLDSEVESRKLTGISS